MLEIRGRNLIDINVNGCKKSIAIRPKDTLLYVLREQLGLSLKKNSCNNGDCDECTVLVDGWPIKACLMLAVEAMDHEITTIEALKEDPIQSKLFEKIPIKDGYCMSSMIINCHALDHIYPEADDEVLEEWLYTNTCRCTGS